VVLPPAVGVKIITISPDAFTVPVIAVVEVLVEPTTYNWAALFPVKVVNVSVSEVTTISYHKV
jgi:hypothetical protein